MHKQPTISQETLQNDIGLSADEAAAVLNWLQSEDDDLEQDLYEMLFTHYCNTGEMPYEVATAGDPMEWIKEKLTA